MNSLTMNDIIIRDYHADDLESICKLINELGYATSTEEMQTRMKRIVTHPDYRTIVALKQNQVLGFAGVFHCLFWEQNGSYIKIQSLVVCESARRKGVGRLLLNEVEKWGKDNGARLITLNSGNRPERVAAHQFYPQSGYITTSTGYTKLLD